MSSQCGGNDFLSAIVGGMFVLAGTVVAHFLVLLNKKSEKKCNIVALRQGFCDELEALWASYMSMAGAQIENLGENTPFLYFWPITQDYFTIYKENAGSISQINDPEFRKLVITTYARARGLVDSFRMNNDLLRGYEHACALFNQTKKLEHQQDVQERLAGLVAYAQSLKKAQTELQIMIGSILKTA